MEITRDDLFVQTSPDRPDLLDNWRWLVGPEAKLFLVSSLGDAFLMDSNGVNWLNVGDGSYTKVAESVADFQSMLSSPDKVNEWFFPQLVGDILTAGLTRAPNECFGFKLAPVLGGEYEPQNFEPTDLLSHFSMLGQIHEQVRDLPEGTPILGVKTE